ncbi:MAG: fumarylacetoacetate hydrolase family protein [Actinobacteria bacterium]|nr:fumarylacetoacetate hydrolase family protein [Actinomycetota bacterium]
MARLQLQPPGKIIAVGLNYRSHAAELGMEPAPDPVLFMKPPSAVIGEGDAIVLPAASRQVDYEAELALVIGGTARGVSQADAADYILGYTCANDVTARDLQQSDGQWTRSKGFDTFCPLGPWVETDPPALEALVELVLNGEVRQSAAIADMIFPPFQLVAFISGIMTLERHDVILTGTPPGVGPLKAGDEVEVRISGVGALNNRVVSGSA